MGSPEAWSLLWVAVGVFSAAFETGDTPSCNLGASSNFPSKHKGFAKTIQARILRKVPGIRVPHDESTKGINARAGEAIACATEMTALRQSRTSDAAGELPGSGHFVVASGCVSYANDRTVRATDPRPSYIFFAASRWALSASWLGQCSHEAGIVSALPSSSRYAVDFISCLTRTHICSSIHSSIKSKRVCRSERSNRPFLTSSLGSPR